MKLIKFLLILFISIQVHSNEIQRKLLAVIPDEDTIIASNVHNKLEMVLNNYGYYLEYIKDDGQHFPTNIEEYAGVVYWNQGMVTKDPIKLVKFFSKFKNKKNIFIGDIPLNDEQNNDYADEVNKILKESFGFEFGKYWVDKPKNISYEYDKSLFGFEMKVSFINQKYFTYIINHNLSNEVVFKENYDKFDSSSAIFGTWGFFAPINKVFYTIDDPANGIEGKDKWIINPFKMVEKIYETSYPIPDTTTKDGKRIAYIHLDGDGILSKSYDNRYTIEQGYDFIKKQGLKTGISFIASELDKNGPILKNEYTTNGTKNHDYKLLNSYAKKTYSLPFVEPASHTYTHPFNWRKGIVAYSQNKNAKHILHGDVKAYQEPDKQVNLKLEIDFSLDYLRKLTNKPINTIYWSGDCYPSLRDLKYIDEHNLLAFNGGDSRFDLEFNSYAYVTPLSLYSKEATQIYSSNSNENTYTKLWSENFWRFRNVIKTFENTGYPKRVKPVNTYYHYYSFAKKSSINALEKIYDYMKKENLEFIYPSEFIKIAKNFHDIKISKENNIFTISNIKDLREFRFEGKVKLSSNEISNYFYDQKLNVTYVRIKENLEMAKLKIKD